MKKGFLRDYSIIQLWGFQDAHKGLLKTTQFPGSLLNPRDILRQIRSRNFSISRTSTESDSKSWGWV